MGQVDQKLIPTSKLNYTSEVLLCSYWRVGFAGCCNKAKSKHVVGRIMNNF